MASEEVRALLVEQGARIAGAYLQQHDAERVLADAIGLLVTGLQEHGIPSFGEQEECFRESCAMSGIDPEHPALRLFWDRFANQRYRQQEQRLREQAETAHLN